MLSQEPDKKKLRTLREKYGIIEKSRVILTVPRARDSWLSALGRMMGKTVNNMSHGGYGPAEYLYLMEKEALTLRPKIIIVGFYIGNDVKDSFTAVYNVPHWKELRKPEFSSASESGDEDDEDSSYGIADWLAGHSVLYRLVSSSFVGDSLRQVRRMSRGEEIVMFRDEKAGIKPDSVPASGSGGSF